MRRAPVVAGVACVALIALAGIAARATSGATTAPTVAITIHLSRFDLPSLRVEPGQTIRFVVTNTDPIDHELLVGDAAMQDRHEVGTEVEHGDRPGEISVPAGATVETTVTFPEELAPGWEFACHLPGHYAYGMRGPITIG